MFLNDWLLEDFNISFVSRDLFGSEQILTTIEDGVFRNIFTELFVKKRDKEFFLYHNDFVGKIPSVVVEKFNLDLVNIISVVPIAVIDEKTFIEITYA